MTAILPGQDPRVAQIFQDMASNQRALKNADEVEQAGKRGRAAMLPQRELGREASASERLVPRRGTACLGGEGRRHGEGRAFCRGALGGSYWY